MWRYFTLDTILQTICDYQLNAHKKPILKMKSFFGRPFARRIILLRPLKVTVRLCFSFQVQKLVNILIPRYWQSLTGHNTKSSWPPASSNDLTVQTKSYFWKKHVGTLCILWKLQPKIAICSAHQKDCRFWG